VDFDESHWSKVIGQPDWPREFQRFAEEARRRYQPDSPPAEELNKKVRHFFETALQDGRVYLGKDGPDFDKERQPADTIVIHHTSAKPGYMLSYLNATQLLNIYVPYYAAQKSQPIWSGHFHNGRQVFWGYHWLMRMDGSFERLLDDELIGWHAGNWDINRRSIGICLDNDYENQEPTDELLRKLAGFIRQTYPDIKPDKIIGHCEARTGTICPGKNFLKTWKPELVEYLSDGP
jgi:hypothetical protein